jgi:pentatricopeptide repeat protein
VYCMNSLMGVHLAQGRYQRVQELYAAMQDSGIAPDMCSTNTAIAACEKLGDGPAALKLLRLVIVL